MKWLIILFPLFLLSACGESVTRTEVVDIPAGDVKCPLGGSKSTEYIDSNSNGHLDSDEIRGTSVYTCVEDDTVTTQ